MTQDKCQGCAVAQGTHKPAQALHQIADTEVEKQIEEVMGRVRKIAILREGGYAHDAKHELETLEFDLRTLLSSAQSGEQAPIAEIVSASHDSAEFGERAVNFLLDFNHLEYGTKLYAHPAPALEVTAVREACARMCDARGESLQQGNMFTAANEAFKCAAAIRQHPAFEHHLFAASQPNGEV